MRIVNLTPHEVVVFGEGGQAVRLLRDGEPARCDVTRKVVGNVDLDGPAVPLVETRAGGVVGLPPPEPDTMYLVSRVVAEASGRADVCYPDDLVRDDAGVVVGCRCFGRPATRAGSGGGGP